jgi:hypothetical protein
MNHIIISYELRVAVKLVGARPEIGKFGQDQGLREILPQAHMVDIPRIKFRA